MRQFPRATLALTVLFLVGCATYRPEPLTSGEALSAPAAAALTRAAANLDQPWLTPVPIDFSQSLDGDALAIIAVLANPDLKAMRARAGIADAQVFSAGLLPDPTFSFGVNPVLSGPDSLLDIAGALGLDLNALRTRGVVRRRAQAEARRVRLDLAWAEWQIAGQARIQAVRILSLEHSAGLAALSRSSARSILDRMMRAAGRGDMAADQVQAARIAAFDADERYRAAETELGAARFELTKLLGLPPDRSLRLASSPLPAPVPDAEALFAIAVAERADLQALRAGYEAQEAAVHKAVLDQFPNLTLTLSGTRDSSGNFMAGPGVDLTLPLWNRNRGGIAIERATRSALQAEYQARLFQTRAEIAAAVAGLALARRQRDQALADLPGLERFAAASRRAADRGDLSIAMAETAEQALRDRQVQIAQSERSIREQTIALELLTGAPRRMWSR